MRTKEEILEKAEKRIHTLEYFDFMGMLAENKRADLELLRELVALVQQPQWIPCSERLPEKYKKVLITYRRMVDGFVKVAAARRMEDGWKIMFSGYCDSENVIAWQPLPEPYKAD